MKQLQSAARIFAVVIVLICTAVPLLIMMEVDRNALEEKAITVHRDLDRIGNLIDSQTRHHPYGTSDWDEDSIVEYVAAYDSEPMTFASLYRTSTLEEFADSSIPVVESVSGDYFTVLSARHESYEGSPFNPFSYKAFCEAIEEAYESDGKTVRVSGGEVLLNFQPEGSNERTMHTFWRYTPDPNDYGNGYLIVVAISKYTVETGVSIWCWIGAGASAIASIFSLFLLFKAVSEARIENATALIVKNDAIANIRMKRYEDER